MLSQEACEYIAEQNETAGHLIPAYGVGQWFIDKRPEQFEHFLENSRWLLWRSYFDCTENLAQALRWMSNDWEIWGQHTGAFSSLPPYLLLGVAMGLLASR